MTPIGMEFSAPWIAGWFGAMARACWQGGLALGLAWATCRLLPRMPAAARSWLWRVAYLKLILTLVALPPILLPVLPRSVDSGRSERASGMLMVSPSPSSHLLRTGFSLLFPADPGDGGATGSPAAIPTSLGLVLFAAWLLGVAWHGLRTAREWRDAGRLKGRCRPVGDEAILHAGAELCRRLKLGRWPRLLLLDGTCSPLALGGTVPAVILPAGLGTACTPGEYRLMLAHELAHMKRRDLTWGWLPTIAHALFFFHPLVWAANREWRLAQEMACDALAVEITQEPVAVYGLTLLKVATRCRPHTSFGLAAIASDEFPHTLKRRLIAMKTMKPISRRRALVAGTALALIGATVLVPWHVVASGTPPTKVVTDSTQPQKTGSATTGLPSLQDFDRMIDGQIRDIMALDLTADQKSRLAPVFAQGRLQVHAIYADSTLTDEQKGRKIKETGALAMSQIEAILTPEQQAKLTHGKSSAEPADPIRSLSAALLLKGSDEPLQSLAAAGLTADQLARVQSLVQAGRQQVQAATADSTLQGAQAKMMVAGAIESFESQLQSILNPDQLKKIEEMFSPKVKAFALQEPLTEDAAAKMLDDQVRTFMDLGLTDDQKAQVQSIVSAGKNRLHAGFADPALSEESRSRNFKETVGSTMEQIQSILTPAQRADLQARFEAGFQAKTSQAEAGFQAKTSQAQADSLVRKDPVGGLAGAILVKGYDGGVAAIVQVGLNADQQARLLSMVRSGRQAVTAVLNDASIPNDQKKPWIGEIVNRFAEQLRSLLTPDQQQRLNNLLDKRAAELRGGPIRGDVQKNPE